ncbi:ATP synthase F1 subunit epsilon [Candidatus Pelagisphaera phototrophica]|uniref:ATP synthase F1 subunit epsilon n=1 Tax=Candidatus Pelagisphaera phototrophica TaxID=2684113 RepID=UPI0019EFBC34|nr:ATP synthase F1 subunit epsilon [Candidatus Pelagisphaera phototrophica]QXD32524.1 ATP synthase F1 subunit epsilon [Candidatus Pelagisphaera phototrophica]
MNIEIVTPEARVYEDTIESVVMPTTSGEIDILPGHIPIVTEVQAGELIVSKSGTRQSLAISKGFAQCVGDKISILAEDAIHIDEIDESAVEEAQKRAEEALATMEKMSDEEVAMLETQISYARAQILVKRKRK